MSEAVAAIVAQWPALSREERAELADAVLRSLEPPGRVDDEAFERELDRRISRIRSGEAVGTLAEDVFAAWRGKRQARPCAPG
ncbi:MAG: addiction module protein [Gemmataceae bacterium]